MQASISPVIPPALGPAYRSLDDETSPLTAFLESSGTEGRSVCRFRRVLRLDGAGASEWADAGSVVLGAEAPLWERARRVREILPEGVPDRPVFAIVRTGAECLVVVALSEGFVAGEIDFDLEPAEAAERLWEACGAGWAA
jgi:hypothetical protein